SLPSDRVLLESFGGATEEGARFLVVATGKGELPARRPRGCAVTRRGELQEALLRFCEGLLGLVEPALLEQRTAEDESCTSDLVQEIDPAVQELERMSGLPF